MQKIAIIGATGMLGQPVTKAFIAAGFDVTLLVRNGEKARRLFGDAVHLVIGDLQDPRSIETVLEGQEAVYLNLAVAQTSREADFQPEREGLQSILEIAQREGIRHIGFLSSLVMRYQGVDGFHWWAFDIKHKAVEMIKRSGIRYSIFYASAFMESFDKGAYRQGSRINLAGDSKHPMYLIAGKDYGKQVVAAFLTDSGNREYSVQGTECYTADQAAKLFVTNSKGVKMAKIPIGMLKFLGRFNRKFNYGAHIVDAINNYPETFEAEPTWQALGKPETSFLDYIKEG
ncbi:MAG: NmrA family protein [Flaviaesturariibacter sp.]|nr:NmrA family protein [Flaviaesturariibacter sp.]